MLRTAFQAVEVGRIDKSLRDQAQARYLAGWVMPEIISALGPEADYSVLANIGEKPPFGNPRCSATRLRTEI